MPILEVPRPGAPLSQGDILKDVSLFLTKESWKDGGSGARSPNKMCLVLSRPCGIEHKKTVIVAGIEKLPEAVPRELTNKDTTTFKKVLNFLTNLRDGFGAPDVLYIGHLPGEKGRFAARLDALHVIEIPTDPAERQTFVTDRRVASLHGDFVRDLHVRAFSAFASLGFDDHGWLTDDDLKWLVDQGKAEMLQAQVTLQGFRTTKASREAEGKAFSQKDLDNAETACSEIEALVKPYEEELARRAPS
jgi:hypothetical protein